MIQYSIEIYKVGGNSVFIHTIIGLWCFIPLSFKIFSFIKVEKVTVNQSDTVKTESANWRCYKHSKTGTGSFTLKKITHSDKDMTGDGLTENMSKTFTHVTAVYVYYQSPTDIRQPKVICIDNGSTRHWYAAGNGPTNWTNADATFQGKNPEGTNPVTETDLTNAQAGTITIKPGNSYVIKLDKRPGATGNIQYRTNGTNVTVTKTVYTTPSESKVPGGYTAYEHQVTISGRNKIILQHNGNTLREVEVTEDQPVTKIFVYYSNSDNDYKFPLIVCVVKQSGRTYYTRGQTWDEATNLATIDPESPDAGLPNGNLANKLNTLKVKYEIDIGKTNTTAPNNTYTANAAGNQITVAKVIGNNTNGVPTGYNRYDHKLADTKIATFNLSSVKHNDIPLSGIPAADLREAEGKLNREAVCKTKTRCRLDLRWDF